MRERSASEVALIEFNPWRWISQDQLAEAFFREIGQALGERSEIAESAELAKLWRKYAALLDVGSNLTSGFQKLLTWGIGIAGALSLASGSSFFSALRPAATAFGVFAVAAAALLLASGKMASKLAAYFDAKSASSEKTLERAKEDLASSLVRRRAPIVVVLDDVDRLTQPQTALLFQLVKANADLPNFVYLMLFHRNIVANSLDTISNGSGAEYLEKIVQISLDIPKIDASRVEAVLFEGLNEHLKDIPEGDFDQVRWGNVFFGGLRQYFESLRDVKRYLASLTFYISLFKLDAGFEVDPIDLIAIEAIRVFSPDAYLAIRNAKDVLTQTGRPYGTAEQANYRARFQSLLEAAPEAEREALRALLETLFPGVEWISGGAERDTGFLAIWLKQRRVCSPEMFDRFFQFGIPENDVSQAEIQQIIGLAGDREQLVKALRALDRRGLLGVLAERLEIYKDEVSLESAIPFVTSMFDIGDFVPDDPPGAFIGPSTHIRRIVHWYLRREIDKSQRMQILARAIEETSGLMQPLVLAYDETSEKRREEDPDSCLVSLEDAESLKRLSVAKISRAALEGNLRNNEKLGPILYRWIDWGSADEVRRWASDVASSPEGALLIIRSLVERGTSQSIKDRVGRVTWQVSLENLERFVNLGKFKAQIDKLGRSTLNERDRNAVRAFERALKRRREGKPDRVWRDSEDDDT